MIQGRKCALGSARAVMNVLNAAIVSSIESNLAAAFGISVEGILGGIVYECSPDSGWPECFPKCAPRCR